jgi:serine/threonine-protein kinase
MSFDRQLLSNALPAYDIGEELGQGGMGVVVSGQHRQLGRRVAIKQLPVAFAADPAVRSRFISEARVLASLDHPHVVPVYDFVEREGVCLLVMEFLPGGTLRSQVAAAGGFTGPHAVAVSLACLSGLSAAHRRGVLHRDVKPENMLFSASEVLKVADFGIAKVLGGPGTVITRRGDVIGTPAYIAPEQARGGDLSPATDVYAVATMLYELLAGVLPFADVADDMALLFKHAYEQPVPLRDVAPGVPGPVAAAVMRGLATESADRFATADSFGTALAEAGTQAWGPGWMSAEQVPIMDAGPIISVAGYPSGPRHAGPTIAPAESGIVTGEREYPLSHAPTQGTGGIAGAPQAGSPQAGSPQAGSPQAGSPQAGSPQAGAAVPARPPSDRRRTLIVVAIVVAIIVIAILAIFVLPKMFTVYHSSAGFGLRYAATH